MSLHAAIGRKRDDILRHTSGTFGIRYSLLTNLYFVLIIPKGVSRISSTLQLSLSSQPAARPSIIILMLKKNICQMSMHGIEMKLVSSVQYVLRCVQCDYLVILLIIYQARSSAQRKELFKIIQERKDVKPVQLLLDMKVRWSSTYVMLHRAESCQAVWC